MAIMITYPWVLPKTEEEQIASSQRMLNSCRQGPKVMSAQNGTLLFPRSLDGKLS